MMKQVMAIAALVALVLSATAFGGAPQANLPLETSAMAFTHFTGGGDAEGAGNGTLICVTNTNVDTTYCEGSDYRNGDVGLHFIYIDGTDWREFDRYEYLTPGDTLCIVTDRHNPDQNDGALVVLAVDPETWEPIAFPYLVGSCIMVDAGLNMMWSYTPTGAAAGRGYTACPPTFLDRIPNGDGDGAADFDGVEYSTLPSVVIIPSFIEESGNFTNELTLFTTAGGDYEVEVNWLFWNNEEVKYSRSQRFRCFWEGSLSEISSVVTDLRGDEDELPPVQTGWAIGTGSRIIDGAGNPVGNLVPPLLGVFSQSMIGSTFMAGDTTYGGTFVDGLEVPAGNGDNF